MFPKKRFFYLVFYAKAIKQKLFLAIAFVCVFSISANFVDTRTQQVMSKQKAYVAIVIDDFGYGGEGTEEMLALDIPITCAIMPFLQGTTKGLEKINKANKEAILHMPMESLHGKKSWVGEKGIFLNMSDEEIRETLNEAFDSAEGVVGINNHMGSAVMEDERALSIAVEAVKGRNLFLLDSVTTPNSKAEELCFKYGVCFMKRDVFLDGTDDVGVVKKNLKKTAEKALENGYAICIGHVGPEGGEVTVQAISEMKEEMEKMGIEFVTLRELLELKEVQYGSLGVYN